jgi:hypothetical protein
MARKASRRLSPQLSLRQVCALLDEAAVEAGSSERWVTTAIGAPGANDIRRLRRRLRRAEAERKERLLFGGGKRGSNTWTTWDALRRAGLIDNVAAVTGAVADAVAELRASLATIEDQQVNLSLLAARQEKAIRGIRAKLGMR